VLYTINIVSKQLYSDNMINFVSSSAEVSSLLIHFRWKDHQLLNQFISSIKHRHPAQFSSQSTASGQSDQ